MTAEPTLQELQESNKQRLNALVAKGIAIQGLEGLLTQSMLAELLGDKLDAALMRYEVELAKQIDSFEGQARKNVLTNGVAPIPTTPRR